jgi:hypothetical protein
MPRGRIPKDPSERQNPRDKPAHEWQVILEVGWQHGDVPKPPTGLVKASRDAWATWMGSWFAAHWSEADLPALRQVVRLYDQVERGEFHRFGHLRMAMDGFGITPKGQQDRRWQAPRPDATGTQAEGQVEAADGQDGRRRSRYSHLRSVETA